MHFSTSFDRGPTLQDLQDSRLEAAEHLTSDLAIISDWGRRNLVSFNASKTRFLNLSTRHNLPNSYPLFFNDTQLLPSSTLNILALPFTLILSGNFTSNLSLTQLSRSWAFCIVSAIFSPPHSWCPYTGALSALVWSTHHMCGGAPRTQLSWTECSLRLFVSSVLLLSLTLFSLLNSAAKLPSLYIFHRYFHSDCSSELANCMPPHLPRPRLHSPLHLSSSLYSPNPLCSS